MKTVREWLREVDEEELTARYFARFPIEYRSVPDGTLTLDAVRERARAGFADYLHRLKALPAKAGTGAVFFAYPTYQEGRRELTAALCHLEELQGEGEVERYSWELVDFHTAMGCLVADTPLTRENLYDTLAVILYELSFFGYTQEGMEAARRKLEAACQEPEEDGLGWDEVREALGLPPERPDPEARALEAKISAAEAEYDSFCFRREVAAVRALLAAAP